MITVEKLIKQLQKIKNKKSIVVMATHPEGNSFAPFSDFSKSFYDDNENYLVDEDDSTENTDAQECICLWPQ